MWIEAVAQLAGKRRASLGREGQCVLENVGGCGASWPDLSRHRHRATPTKSDMIAPSRESFIVELLTPRGEPRQNAVVVARIGVARDAEQAPRARDEERVHQPRSK